MVYIAPQFRDKQKPYIAPQFRNTAPQDDVIEQEQSTTQQPYVAPQFRKKEPTIPLTNAETATDRLRKQKIESEGLIPSFMRKIKQTVEDIDLKTTEADRMIVPTANMTDTAKQEEQKQVEARKEKRLETEGIGEYPVTYEAEMSTQQLPQEYEKRVTEYKLLNAKGYRDAIKQDMKDAMVSGDLKVMNMNFINNYRLMGQGVKNFLNNAKKLFGGKYELSDNEVEKLGDIYAFTDGVQLAYEDMIKESSGLTSASYFIQKIAPTIADLLATRAMAGKFAPGVFAFKGALQSAGSERMVEMDIADPLKMTTAAGAGYVSAKLVPALKFLKPQDAVTMKDVIFNTKALVIDAAVDQLANSVLNVVNNINVPEEQRAKITQGALESFIMNSFNAGVSYNSMRVAFNKALVEKNISNSKVKMVKEALVELSRLQEETDKANTELAEKKYSKYDEKLSKMSPEQQSESITTRSVNALKRIANDFKSAQIDDESLKKLDFVVKTVNDFENGKATKDDLDNATDLFMAHAENKMIDALKMNDINDEDNKKVLEENKDLEVDIRELFTDMNKKIKTGQYDVEDQKILLQTMMELNTRTKNRDIITLNMDGKELRVNRHDVTKTLTEKIMAEFTPNNFSAWEKVKNWYEGKLLRHEITGLRHLNAMISDPVLSKILIDDMYIGKVNKSVFENTGVKILQSDNDNYYKKMMGEKAQDIHEIQIGNQKVKIKEGQLLGLYLTMKTDSGLLKMSNADHNEFAEYAEKLGIQINPNPKDTETLKSVEEQYIKIGVSPQKAKKFARQELQDTNMQSFLKLKNEIETNPKYASLLKDAETWKKLVVGHFNPNLRVMTEKQYGAPIETSDDYYPLMIMGGGKQSFDDILDNAFQYTKPNFAIAQRLKSRVKSHERGLFIGDAYHITHRMIQDMGRMYGMSEPIANVKKLFNTTIPRGTDNNNPIKFKNYLDEKLFKRRDVIAHMIDKTVENVINPSSQYRSLPKTQKAGREVMNTIARTVFAYNYTAAVRSLVGGVMMDAEMSEIVASMMKDPVTMNQTFKEFLEYSPYMETRYRNKEFNVINNMIYKLNPMASQSKIMQNYGVLSNKSTQIAMKFMETSDQITATSHYAAHKARKYDEYRQSGMTDIEAKTKIAEEATKDFLSAQPTTDADIVAPILQSGGFAQFALGIMFSNQVFQNFSKITTLQSEQNALHRRMRAIQDKNSELYQVTKQQYDLTKQSKRENTVRAFVVQPVLLALFNTYLKRELYEDKKELTPDEKKKLYNSVVKNALGDLKGAIPKEYEPFLAEFEDELLQTFLEQQPAIGNFLADMVYYMRSTAEGKQPTRQLSTPAMTFIDEIVTNSTNLMTRKDTEVEKAINNLKLKIKIKQANNKNVDIDAIALAKLIKISEQKDKITDVKDEIALYKVLGYAGSAIGLPLPTKFMLDKKKIELSQEKENLDVLKRNMGFME